MTIETLRPTSFSPGESFVKRPTFKSEIFRAPRLGNLSYSTVEKPTVNEVNPTAQPWVRETAEGAKKVIFTTTGVLFIGYGLYRLATADSMTDVAVGAIFTYMGYKLIKSA